MTAPTHETPVTVGGRHFYVTRDTTYEQDMYVMSVMRKAGLEKLAAEFDMTNVEGFDEVAQSLVVTAFENGQLFRMLGGILEEDGFEWTPEEADENAIFFSQLRDKEDKEALRGSMVAAILGFFVNGLLSSRTSPNSSTNVTMQPVSTRPSVVSPSSSAPLAETTTSEPGERLSESLPDIDPPITPPS